MRLERVGVEAPRPPFPIYADPVADLLRAHGEATVERDPVVAHILAVLAGYAYGDAETVAMMASRLGMAGGACVRINETVDAMFIFSTAYVLQSRCGRLAVLCYRGTEPANLGNWLGDADVGSDAMTFGGAQLAVHAGFYRNVRATRWPVLETLRSALRGESLLDPQTKLEHTLEALYITGHSLGGAMAVLFALGLAAEEDLGSLAGKLRAVYTFGQPLATGAPLPATAREIEQKVFRHINGRDIVPCLPPRMWGRFEHFGHEYRFTEGAWRKEERVATQLSNLREIPRSLLAALAPARRRQAAPYTMADHAPHQYIAALRPIGRITELADRG